MTICVRRLFVDANESRQAYDFFSNPKVSGEICLEPHYKNTIERVKASNADKEEKLFERLDKTEPIGETNVLINDVNTHEINYLFYKSKINIDYYSTLISNQTS